jgi:hypothetical protein
MSIQDTLHGLMRKNRIDDGLLVRAARPLYDQWAIRNWHRNGEPAPPPYAIKRNILRDFARQFGLRIFVETGTFYGDTSFALRNCFDRLFSIELDHTLFERASQRLRRYKQITVLEGDSGQLIPSVLAEIGEPVLFWLDAHYSGGITAHGSLGSPISRELDTIFSHSVPNHVILIDDARDFTGQDGYPTVRELRESMLARRPDLNMEVRHDIIRIHQRDRGQQTSFA